MVTVSPSASGARGLATARVFSQDGTLVAVSHDRWTIERLGEQGGQVWELRDGRLIQHHDAPALVVAGLVYLAITIPLTRLVAQLEKRNQMSR